MNIKLYAYAIIATLALSGITYGVLEWNSMKDTIQLQQKALDGANAETEKERQNVKNLKAMVDRKNSEAESLRENTKRLSRIAADRKAEISNLLAGPIDSYTAAAITFRVRTALERIQGHKFDGARAAIFTTSPRNAALCIGRAGVSALAYDLESVADSFELIYQE